MFVKNLASIVLCWKTAVAIAKKLLLTYKRNIRHIWSIDVVAPGYCRHEAKL